jgi:8-oxo-dGTP pyrophosphatase MutT (NUDIX family)
VKAGHRDLELPATTRADFERCAQEWLRGDRAGDLVPPRTAASVVLLREAGTSARGGLEVFTQQRVAGMAFAASMYVYPGGGVDERDGEGDLDWAGPGRTPEQWADRLGVDVDRARLVVLAALRELFEECGVLLAGQGRHALLGELGPSWQGHRSALVARSLTVAEMARSESLLLRTDLLHPLARWVTPACEPRRYDTFFFAAVLPPGQCADAMTSEARCAGWLDPRELLQRAGHRLMAPTRLLAEELSAVTALDSYLSRQRSLEPVCPYPVKTADGIRLRVPAGG